MSVFQDKRRNKRWSYDFWLAGRRYQGYCADAKGLPAKNKREALDCEAAVRTAVRKNEGPQVRSLRAEAYTLNQACVAYLARKEETEASNYDNHVMYVREIRAFLNGDKAMADITADDIENYRRHCAAQAIKVWIGGQRRKDDPRANRFWKDTGRVRSKKQVNNYLKCLRALFAIATKVRHKTTRAPVIDEVPEIQLHWVPKRLPRPITDAELDARLDSAPPWTREAAELSRLFGLRRGETFWLERRHVDHETQGIRFLPNETKSGNEELAHGGIAGWQLLLQLDRQAFQRKQRHLVTWPGKTHFQKFLAGKPVPTDCWGPLKSIRKSWTAAARRAGVVHPHRFHDIRARYITEVAKVLPAAAQDAARHQDSSTTAMYVKLASSEIRDAVAQAVARRAGTKKSKAIG